MNGRLLLMLSLLAIQN